MKKFSINQILILLVIIIIIIVSGYYVVSQYYCLSSQCEISYVPGEKNKKIKKFAANEPEKIIGQDMATKQNFQVITQDDTYLEVKVPSKSEYEKIKFAMKYQNPDQQPEIKVNSKSLQMYNPMLDNLSEDDWYKLEDDNLHLWQRYPKLRTIEDDTAIYTNQEVEFDNINNFINNLPDRNKVLLYNYDLPNWAELEDYQASNDALTIDQAIRGEYEIYAYIKNEDLNFNFTIEDINTSLGPDNIIISLFHEGKSVEEKEYSDEKDFIVSETKQNTRQAEFKVSDLEEGVYKIVFTAPEDIITTKIITTQNKLVFSKQLYLVGNEFYKKYGLEDLNTTPAEFYFYGNQIKFKTKHKAAKQTISIGEEDIELKKDDKYYFIENLDGTNKITTQKNDVLFESSGYFAFSEDNFFIPQQSIENVWTPTTDLAKFNYILASYQEPVVTDQWYYAEEEFSAEQIDTDSGLLGIMINAPGLKDNDRKLKISEIKIMLIK